MVSPSRRLAMLSRSETSRTLVNSLLALLLSFGCGVITARLLGPSDRGILSLILVVTTTTALIAALGSNVAVRVGSGVGSSRLMLSYARVSAVLTLLQVALSGGFVLLLFWIVRPQVALPPLLALSLLVGLSAFVAQQAFDALNAVGRSGSSAFAKAVGAMATFVVLGVSVVLKAGLYVSLLSYAIGFIVSSAYSLMAYGRHGALSDERVDHGASKLIRRGVPLLGLNLGQALALKLDQLAVGILAGPSAAGLYVVAAAHAMPSQASSFAISQVVLHRAARRMLTASELVRFLALGTGVALVGSAGIWLLAPWFVPFVFGEEFRASVDILRILMIGQIFLAPYLLCSRVVMGRGHTRLASLSGVGLAALLGGLLVVLTPMYGPVGAAWATTIAFTVAAFLMMLATALSSARSSPLTTVPAPTSTGSAYSKG